MVQPQLTHAIDGQDCIYAADGQSSMDAKYDIKVRHTFPNVCASPTPLLFTTNIQTYLLNTYDLE